MLTGRRTDRRTDRRTSSIHKAVLLCNPANENITSQMATVAQRFWLTGFRAPTLAHVQQLAIKPKETF